MAKHDYSGLIEKLEGQKWPSDYVFKFIVKGEKDKIDEVLSFFNKEIDTISYKSSEKGTYTSITIVRKASSTDEIISVYESMSEIQGIIAL
ncbi:MAG: DUF493 family protein [Cytophagales bacterium]